MPDEEETQLVPKDIASTEAGAAVPYRITDSCMEAMLGGGASRQSSPSSAHQWLPPSAEEVQRALPQYEVQQFLARGGMGAVYKGVQRSLDRTVAIKILPPGIEDGDVHFAQRFKQEAKAMAKFKHPGIVAVYDAGETADGLLYFVMEFIEGTDVAQLVASQGKVSSDEALRITAHVCDALAYAHARGVVHRDIKPSNVMIDTDRTVKVADFGLAKMTAQESGGITQTNMAMGTPDFVAPEALIAGIPIDQRADLYAVGVMLYQMLTGRIPRGRFEMPSDMLPKLDPRFDAIVDKAMQTDRDKRYSSAVEMRADIDRMLTQPVPVTLQPRRSKAAAWTAAAAVIGVAISGELVWKKAHAHAVTTDTNPAGIANGASQKLKEPAAIKLWDSPQTDYYPQVWRASSQV